MLIAKCADTSGNIHTLSKIISMTLNRDEFIPADDLKLVVPLDTQLPELRAVTLLDGGEVVFTGVVDEQQSILDTKHAVTSITARSMAAVLLDNEAHPVNYYFPTASVIFYRHLKPHGIKDFKASGSVYKGSLAVSKGATCWQVLLSFCKKAFGTFPRVESDGTVNFSGVESVRKLRFSDSDIPYISVKENTKRCKPLSDVYVKLPTSKGYFLNIENSEAKARGIDRVRYFDASLSGNIDIPHSMVNNSERTAYSLYISTPRRLLNSLGAETELDDAILGKRKDLRVSAVYYSLSPEGERTTLRLRKEY